MLQKIDCCWKALLTSTCTTVDDYSKSFNNTFFFSHYFGCIQQPTQNFSMSCFSLMSTYTPHITAQYTFGLLNAQTHNEHMITFTTKLHLHGDHNHHKLEHSSACYSSVYHHCEKKITSVNHHSITT